MRDKGSRSRLKARARGATGTGYGNDGLPKRCTGLVCCDLLHDIGGKEGSCGPRLEPSG